MYAAIPIGFGVELSHTFLCLFRNILELTGP